MNNRRTGLPTLSPRAVPADDVAVSLVDIGTGRWRVAMYFRAAPDETMVRRLTAAAAGTAAAKALRFERVAAKDWVRESLAGLAPVTAGRFIVHGAHDRARIPLNRIGIEIEAALAFGTGHHGTTRGCLLALDWLCKSLPPTAHPRSRHRLGRARHRRGARLAAARARNRHRRQRGARGPRQCRAQSRRRFRRSDKSGRRHRTQNSASARPTISSSPISCCGRCNASPRRSRGSPRPARVSFCPACWRPRPMPPSRPIAAWRSNGGSISTAGPRWSWSAASGPGPALPEASRPHRLPPCSRPTSSRSRIAASAPKARRAWRRCGRSLQSAASTASSCRAPTASRTNMCRRAPSSWPGSPASPARPASPSCSPTAR